MESLTPCLFKETRASAEISKSESCAPTAETMEDSESPAAIMRSTSALLRARGACIAAASAEISTHSITRVGILAITNGLDVRYHTLP